MPSWLNDLWALSPWAAEPERDAAQAPSLANFLPPHEPLVPGAEITYETEDWYQMLRSPWPPKAAVIPVEKYVGKEMKENEVKTWVNRYVQEGGTRREKIECFDVAAYQLSRVKARTGGPPAEDSRSLQILINYLENGDLVEKVQVPETIEAVMYIKEVLHQDIPVLVGICIRGYRNRDGTRARPNDRESTWFVEPSNHYVVIVGMDADDNGRPYFQYYDYHFHPETSDGQACKLFLQPTMKLERTDREVVLAEVRHTL
jgi:hypothetical protein